MQNFDYHGYDPRRDLSLGRLADADRRHSRQKWWIVRCFETICRWSQQVDHWLDEYPRRFAPLYAIILLCALVLAMIAGKALSLFC